MTTNELTLVILLIILSIVVNLLNPISDELDLSIKRGFINPITYYKQVIKFTYKTYPLMRRPLNYIFALAIGIVSWGILISIILISLRWTKTLFFKKEL